MEPLLVLEATEILESIINSSFSNAHSFHVIGSQGLAWSRRGIHDRERRSQYLRNIMSQVEKGIERYPRNQDLQTLHADIRREYLHIAVSDGK